MKEFTFSSFEATWTVRTPLSLPAYAGSTIRGAFGGAFRRVACTMRQKSCAGCLLHRQCVYSVVFETKKEDGVSEAVRPFVLEPPTGTPHNFVPGETFLTRLVLFGRAIDYLPYFLVSFRELGERGLGSGRGKCKLTELSAVNPLTGDRAVVYRDKDKRVLDVNFELTASEVIRTASIPCADRLTIDFLTYTRLKYRNHFIDRLEFSVFIARLIDRFEALSGSSPEGCPWLNGKTVRELIGLAKNVRIAAHPAQWLDWTRYSARQNTRLKMGGVKGKVIYEGGFEPFLPLLAIGQHLHVGKGTVFGLGKYRVESE